METRAARRARLRLAEECWRLVVSFAGATDVLALRKVSDTFRELTRHEMVGSVLLPTNQGTVVVWNAATGITEEVLLSTEEQRQVEVMAMAPDGLSLATVNRDDVVRVWRTATGEHVVRLPGTYREVAWSPDAKVLACGNYQSTVALYDAATGEPVSTFERPHRRPTYALAFSPNGKLLASCGGENGTDEAIAVWNLETGAQQLWSFQGRNKQWTSNILFSPDSTRLYSNGGDEYVRVFSCETGLMLFEIECPLTHKEDGVSGVALSSDGSHLATVDLKAVYLWDARTGSLQRTIRAPTIRGRPIEFDHGVAFSLDARRLIVTIGGGFDACFVDTTTGSIVGSQTGGRGWRLAEVQFFLGCHFTTSPF
eukprot:CAMPEP_0118910486 /NCGR_PEP_ID=MMETSP1166-20130328/12602_1 /TAXON_ID=1104430 /ORGANISM="Chrysoreinhardia sp, Strain CCMP3193" /LENGTH=367 /DNA_ID=CAMNT_0006849953 /DNA_START=30 /DNA_END=1133 /DNA_ORIENTATION=+